jgi:hypothetical protein
MNIRLTSTVVVKKAIPAMLLCTGMLVTNIAHAGWLADFLCWGDNDPAVCRSHLPIAVQKAALPNYTDEAARIVNEAAKLKGDQKNAFIEKHSQLLLGVASNKSKQ